MPGADIPELLNGRSLNASQDAAIMPQGIFIHSPTRMSGSRYYPAAAAPHFRLNCACICLPCLRIGSGHLPAFVSRVDDPGEFPDAMRSAMIGILEHLLYYPDAKDTVDGIRRWWLSGHDCEFRREEVLHALKLLAQQGLLVESSFGEDTRVYGISPAGLEEVAAQIERLKQ
jgi:hypothetical protein